MVTENMRTEYRRALMRGGVPAVYAYMAAQALATEKSRCDLRGGEAVDLLFSGFYWGGTDLGHEFWNAIAQEAAA